MDALGHKACNFADVEYFCQELPHYSDWESNSFLPLNFPDPSSVPTLCHNLASSLPHCSSSSSSLVLANQELLRSEVPNGFQDLGFFGSFLTTIGSEANHFTGATSNHLTTPSGNCWNACAAQLPYETASSSISSEGLVLDPDSSDGNLPRQREAAGEADDSYKKLSTNAEEQAVSSVLERKDVLDGGAAEFTERDNTGYKTTGFHGGKRGLPAKNLMAERRRRKKLNDRLYTLRSIVPKISKMDRTSILGDAIDYLKELQQRIETVYTDLQSPVMSFASKQKLLFEEELQTSVTFPMEVDVQTSGANAISIHMFCEQRPGLLLSTMRALDGLGVDVQEADIKFTNGFQLEIYAEQSTKKLASPEEIKAVLMHTAGYFNPVMPC
ncbi:transcription factor SCREAM2 [Selaginella moellendorffii]|uniref:transcription factor SCREAM2 n=1 Tax=Selaginella moellendorffii TaxID=88036 RepID=UPI000D1CACC5|nr:transcription factor SCREAM2 [Selaginella moellendorffii]XP_024535552.1 transcription factor SCREAM2 [Selaginella moellendorffii]|eukprot:XP_024535551.1 transcription factor SCREAM2 [Selaginella moellendorffii]